MPATGNDGPSPSRSGASTDHHLAAQPYSQAVFDHNLSVTGLDYRHDERGHMIASLRRLITTGYTVLTGPVPPEAQPDARGAVGLWQRSGMPPFVIAANLTAGRVTMNTPHGLRTYTAEQFADHLATTPALQQHPTGPIVLLIPHAAAGGMHLPRTIAAHNTHGEPRHQLSTLGGHVQENDLTTYTLVDENGHHLGRATFSTSEWLDRVSDSVNYGRQSTYHYGKSTQNGTIEAIDPHFPLPWVNTSRQKPPYFFASHGTRQNVWAYDSQGRKHELTGPGIGNLLKRRPSLQLDQDREIVLLVCSVAAPGQDGTVIAQQVADITGRTVYAPSGRVAHDASIVEEGSWHTFRPHAQRPQAETPISPSPETHSGEREGHARGTSRSQPQQLKHTAAEETSPQEQPGVTAPQGSWAHSRSATSPGVPHSLETSAFAFAERPPTFEEISRSAVMSQWVVSHGELITGVDYRYGGDGRLATAIDPPITERFLHYNTPQLPNEVRQGIRGAASPWGDVAPIMVIADRSSFGVAVTSLSGPTEISFENFSRHVRKVIEYHGFPAGAPVVLVMPYAAAGRIELPRILAAHTGRDVWASDGPVALLKENGRGAATTWIVQHEPAGIAVSRWIVSRPGALNSFADQPERIHLTATTGETVPASALLTHTLINERGEPIGQAVDTAEDWPLFEEELRELNRVTTYRTGEGYLTEQGRGAVRARPNAPYRALPWVRAGEQSTPYFFVTHGDMGVLKLPTRTGTILPMPGEQVGRLLAQVPLISQRPYASIVLAACFSGYDAENPLNSVAQRVADVTGRTVHAPWSKVSNALSLVEGHGDQEGYWFTYRPRQAAPRPGIGHPGQPLPPHRTVAGPIRGHARSGSAAAEPATLALRPYRNLLFPAEVGSMSVGLDYRHDGAGHLSPQASAPRIDMFITHAGDHLPSVIPVEGQERPAPWGSVQPLLIAADLAPGGVSVMTTGGSRTLAIHEFARLVSSETAINSTPPHVPVVLLVPNAAAGEMHLPRMLAHLTERTVWATDGELALVTTGNSGPSSLAHKPVTHVLLHRRTDGEGGRWLRSLPTDLDAQIARLGDTTGFPEVHTLSTIEGGSVDSSEIPSYTLTDENYIQTGRAIFSREEWGRIRSHFSDVSKVREYARSTEDGTEEVSEDGQVATTPVPWGMPSVIPYYLVTHGRVGGVALPTPNGRAHVDGQTLGQWLRRRASFESHPRPIVLLSCRSGETREGVEISVAQEVAEITGQTVYAPSTAVWTDFAVDSTDGGRWETFRPQQTGSSQNGRK
ncbi:hypothetical protein [Streptomyces sp. NRRL S-340]|uniref:hypothetical protein n=1 Tax=Streptomyces sp. NRRL S-340 TaxID=1463901 RepID=UPI001F3C1B8D|nr:hypothetical protein [Streptomyces sp. NRRL S-340]